MIRKCIAGTDASEIEGLGERCTVTRRPVSLRNEQLSKEEPITRMGASGKKQDLSRNLLNQLQSMFE